MKRIPFLLLSVLILVSVRMEACAYDFREDAIAQDERFEEISSLGSLILADLNSEGAGAAQSRLVFDAAVRVFPFEASAFLDAIQTGFEEALSAQEEYVWKVPVSAPRSDELCAIIGVPEDGPPGYVTVSGVGLSVENLAYLYQREETDSLLSGLTFDSVYVTSLLPWSVDFITLVSGEEVGFVPYAARPDFMDIENGTYYTSEEISGKIREFLADMGDGTAANGGADGLNQSGPSIASVIGGLAVLFGCVLLLFHFQGKKNGGETR